MRRREYARLFRSRWATSTQGTLAALGTIPSSRCVREPALVSFGVGDLGIVGPFGGKPLSSLDCAREIGTYRSSHH